VVTALAAPVLITTSFATELATPSVTDVRTYVRTYGHLTAFNIYKDIVMAMVDVDG